MHLQIVLELGCPGTNDGALMLKGMLKNALPPVAGISIQAKPLTDGQTFVYMLGYVQKDAGKPHFLGYFHGVDAAMLQRARREYNLVKMSHEEDKKLIHKKTLVKQLYQVWKQFFYPVPVGSLTLLRWMVTKLDYMPTAHFLQTSAGRGMPRP